jgi:aldehyde dehydrogenase
VLNVVFGRWLRGRRAARQKPAHRQDRLHRRTTARRQIMQYAAETLIPMTLGGKSPNIFFADVMERNKGEMCTCPSRALVQESIFDMFMEKAVVRVARIKIGDPIDPATQMGAHSKRQLEKILNYIDIGKKEGAKRKTGGERRQKSLEMTPFSK